MKKRLCAWLVTLLLPGSPALAENEIHSKESLNAQGRRIGISQGSAHGGAAHDPLLHHFRPGSHQQPCFLYGPLRTPGPALI